MGHAQYQVKPANLLGVALGAALFGIGMVLYGYCPGTGVAAIATGSLHALVGFAGMLAGAVLYALSYPWVEKHIQPVAALGKVRLPDITGIPDLGWLAILLAIAGDCGRGILALFSTLRADGGYFSLRTFSALP